MDCLRRQAFTWRREARERAKESGAVSFAPVVMTTRAGPKIERGAAIIEIVIGAARVRVPARIDVATLQSVLHAGKGRHDHSSGGAYGCWWPLDRLILEKVLIDLVALVREALVEDPLSGTIFVFRTKRADGLKS